MTRVQLHTLLARCAGKVQKMGKFLAKSFEMLVDAGIEPIPNFGEARANRGQSRSLASGQDGELVPGNRLPSPEQPPSMPIRYAGLANRLHQRSVLPNRAQQRDEFRRQRV